MNIRVSFLWLQRKHKWVQLHNRILQKAAYACSDLPFKSSLFNELFSFLRRKPPSRHSECVNVSHNDMQGFAFTICVHYQKENGSKKARPFCWKKKKPKNLYSIRFIIKTTNNKQIERNGIYFSFNHIFSHLFI